ncbi:MAG TPA: flagellar motor switch protein FliN [Gammaproteobacteria bacterium]|nr:flagellar motor switch protein FliN [Gammaproteobacteria bacterium]
MTELEHGAASADDDWAAALAEQRSAEAGEAVARAPLESFAPGGDAAGRSTADLEQILDIPITLSVEIGKSRLTIRNLLQLNQGSVVELDRMAGEPLDVMINGTLVAHGEVVVINEKFGIRLTDVVSAQERVKKLR